METQSAHKEKVEASVDTIITLVENVLQKEHGLSNNVLSHPKNFLVFERNGLERALAEKGFQVENGFGTACTLPLPDENPEIFVWLDLDYPLIAGLVNFTGKNFEDHLSGLLIASEEISHLLYIRNHLEKYKRQPYEWAEEMVAGLDKYLITQALFFRYRQRLMTQEESDEIIRTIFTAEWLKGPRRHEEGHKLGHALVDRLNLLAGSGQLDEANRLQEKIYHADEENLKAVLGRLGLTPPSRWE